MADENSIAGAGLGDAEPGVRQIGIDDLKYALTAGFADFNEKPSHLVLLVLIYPLVGLFMVRVTAGHDILPLVFPIISGFALIGPLAAVGLYELSRRRELGLDVAWKHVFDVLKSPSLGALLLLGLLQMAIYFVWLAAALAIYASLFGLEPPASYAGFAQQVLTTGSGWTLILVGSCVGFLFAVLVLTISVVSFPLLLDKNVGAATAIRTSINACLENPLTMAAWGLIVAVGLIVGSVPFLVGLAVVMPVLGHATWHLYRRVVTH